MLRCLFGAVAGRAPGAVRARLFGSSAAPPYEVLRIVAGGSEPPLLADLTHTELGLPSRDALFFERSEFCVPPAALLWRRDALLVRLVSRTEGV